MKQYMNINNRKRKQHGKSNSPEMPRWETTLELFITSKKIISKVECTRQDLEMFCS